MKIVTKDFFGVTYVQCSEKLHKLHNDTTLLTERIKIKNFKNLKPICMIKKRMCFKNV